MRETELPNDDPKTVHVYHTDVPRALVLPTSEGFLTKTFVVSLSEDKADALNFYNLATANDGDALLSSHKQVLGDLFGM